MHINKLRYFIRFQYSFLHAMKLLLLFFSETTLSLVHELIRDARYRDARKQSIAKRTATGRGWCPRKPVELVAEARRAAISSASASSSSLDAVATSSVTGMLRALGNTGSVAGLAAHTDGRAAQYTTDSCHLRHCTISGKYAE